MTFAVRITPDAQADLERLFEYLAIRDHATAVRARAAIRKGYDFLAEMPFACRKVEEANPFLRELIIPFGNAGYVALFEIEGEDIVTILAIRHQREEDYH